MSKYVRKIKPKIKTYEDYVKQADTETQSLYKEAKKCDYWYAESVRLKKEYKPEWKWHRH